MRREAEMRKVERRKMLAELQNQFKQLLEKNQGLPEHVRLHRTVHTHKPLHPKSTPSSRSV